MTHAVVVVAAVVEENGRFLVAQRQTGTHLAGYWEFPGGKVHPAEIHEDALRREMLEELNTSVEDIRPVFSASHEYSERTVELHFYRCALTKEPTPMLGQQLRWISREDFRHFNFPPADTELIAGLVEGTL